MKKLLFALALGLLLVAALATTAMADNGPHGGTFSATTDACANCHRAHSAVIGENALLVQEAYHICMSCHDGTGAGTDVFDGVYNQAGSDTYYVDDLGMAQQVEGVDGMPLFGGGFVYAAMSTAWTGVAGFDNAVALPALGSAHVTSTHTVEGLPVWNGAAFVTASGSGTVWGSGANNSTNDTATLECISCHNPHGKAGWTYTSAAGNDEVATATYRLLRWIPEGSNGFTDPTAAGSEVNWTGGAYTNGSFFSDMKTSTATDDAVYNGWTVPDTVAAIGAEWYTINSDANMVTFAATADYRNTPFGLGDYSLNTENLYSTTFVVSIDDPAQKAFDNRWGMVNTAYFCAQCHDRYFNNSSLRNDEDRSNYCNTAADNVTAVAAPTALSDLHPVVAKQADCEASYTPVVRNGPLVWHWADLRSSGDSVYQYRHASGDFLRNSEDGTVTASHVYTITAPATVPATFNASSQSYRTCLSCHVAHGTSAVMGYTPADSTWIGNGLEGVSGMMDVADDPATPLVDETFVGGSLAGGSTLLRMDGRSICLRCHASAVASSIVP